MSLKALLSTFFSSTDPEEAPISEAERLIAEIEETKEKLEYAWKRMDYAAPDYVEITVLELLLLETQYSLLNKRYRLLLGIKEESPSQLQSHAFYSSIYNYNTVTESASAIAPSLISPSP